MIKQLTTKKKIVKEVINNKKEFQLNLIVKSKINLQKLISKREGNKLNALLLNVAERKCLLIEMIALLQDFTSWIMIHWYKTQKIMTK